MSAWLTTVTIRTDYHTSVLIINIQPNTLHRDYESVKLSVRDHQHKCVFIWSASQFVPVTDKLDRALTAAEQICSCCYWAYYHYHTVTNMLRRIGIQKDAVNSQLMGNAHCLFPDNSSSWHAGVFPVNTPTSSDSLSVVCCCCQSLSSSWVAPQSVSGLVRLSRQAGCLLGYLTVH